MSSRREQLKEQMARTQDPLVRMQLGALLNARPQRRSSIPRKIEDAFDSWLGPAIKRWPAGVPGALFLIVLTIIVFVIVVILECISMPR